MSPLHEWLLKFFFVGGIACFFAFLWMALSMERKMSQADEIQFAMGCVKDAGGQNVGVSYLSGGPLIWWTDGKTKSTLAMPASKITSVFDVSDHISQSRAKFEKKEAADETRAI